MASALMIERDVAVDLLATAPVIILVLDARGRIRHVNPHFEQLTGYTLDEVSGRDWFSTFVPARDHARIRTLFETPHDSERPRGSSNPIVTRGGEEREIEWNDQVLYDAGGNISGWLAVGLDITERKRVAEALNASQRKLHDILDAMYAFVGLFSLDGTILEVNRIPLLVANLRRDQVVGRLVWDTPFFADSAESRAQVKDMLERSAAGETQRADLPLLIANGRHIVVDAAFAPVLGEDGQVRQVVGSAVDVTEQRMLERHRQELEAQLRQRQKLEALGTLAGGIAHDFNNTLMAILGNVELARESDCTPERVRESLNEIETAGRRAQDLVQRILAFSRKQEQPLKRVHILPVIEEALKLLRSTLPARIDLLLSATYPDAQVMADASALHQVITNLVTNAWHAIAEAPGRIAITVAREELATRKQGMDTDLRAGSYVRVDVEDTGSGMSPGTLERIFEPFFTTKSPGQGTGLGLSVVHGIMKAHGGAVEVQSELGKGTLFRLYFPAVEMKSQSEPKSTDAPSIGQGERVLYVDDERALVDVAVRLLERAGYRVEAHVSGESALAAVRREPSCCDVVVTDQSMPGMTGISLAEELRKLRPGLPIVLVSGYLREEELQRAIDNGIDEVVMKPATIEHLGSVIRAVLSRARS